MSSNYINTLLLQNKSEFTITFHKFEKLFGGEIKSAKRGNIFSFFFVYLYVGWFLYIFLFLFLKSSGFPAIISEHCKHTKIKLQQLQPAFKRCRPRDR